MLSLHLHDGVLTFRLNLFFWRRKPSAPRQGQLPLPPPFPLPPLSGMPRRRTAADHLMDAPALYAEQPRRPKPAPPVPDVELAAALAKTYDGSATLPPDDETRAQEPSGVTDLRRQRVLVRKALRAAAR